tara:strand:+ start:1119 stop:1691 length:573 start_codon:yes stop_codon:yes gene_type:complete
MKGGSLYEFLKEKNGRHQMNHFLSGCVVIQCVIIGLTVSRAAIEFNSYAVAVAIINAFSTCYVGLDLACWQFTNSVSLLFVIICDSICTAANILICFVPGDVRVLSFFVLAFSFILHAMIVSFVMSTLVRKITSQDTTVDMHKSSIETAVNSVGDLETRIAQIMKIPLVEEQLKSIDLNGDSGGNNNVFV